MTDDCLMYVVGGGMISNNFIALLFASLYIHSSFHHVYIGTLSTCLHQRRHQCPVHFDEREEEEALVVSQYVRMVWGADDDDVAEEDLCIN